MARRTTSPLHIVKKVLPSGEVKIRPVIDLRAINSITKAQNYPLVHIDEILSNLNNCSYFTILDISKAFWHLKVREKDQIFYCFQSNNKVYKTLRCPFGAKNSPFTWLKCIKAVLGNQPNIHY